MQTKQDTNLILHKVTKKCNRFENLRHDTLIIEGRENFQMHAVRKKTNKVKDILKNINLVVEDQPNLLLL